MAKFRRQAAPVQWNNGPAGWVHWTENWNEPHEHENATVYHHEQPFSLEIMPSRSHPKSFGPSKPYGWSWGIFMHGHDKLLAERGTQQNSEWIHPGNWEDKQAPGVEYVGEAPSPEEAKEAAERAWEDHKRAVGGALGGEDMPVDYEKLVNPRDDLNDDFGDIFGDRS